MNPLGAICQLVNSEGFTKLVKIRAFFKFSLLGSFGQIGSIFPKISLEFVEKERKHHLDCGIQWYLTIFLLPHPHSFQIRHASMSPDATEDSHSGPTTFPIETKTVVVPGTE